MRRSTRPCVLTITKLYLVDPDLVVSGTRSPQTLSRKQTDMKAYVVEKYSKDGLRAADVPHPTVGDTDVLVKVSAASINPLDKMVRDGEFKQLIKY